MPRTQINPTQIRHADTNGQILRTRGGLAVWDDDLFPLQAAFDGGGSPIPVGKTARVYCPVAVTITASTIIADVSGSIVIDVWVSSYPTAPTSANSITGSAKPTISNSDHAQDIVLGNWSTSVPAGSWIVFHVDSCSEITSASICLSAKRSS